MIFYIKTFISLLVAYFIGLNIFFVLNNYKRNDYFIQRIHSFFLGLGVTSLLFWFFTVFSNGRNLYYSIFELLLVVFLFIKNKKRPHLKNLLINSSYFSKKNIISFVLLALIFIYVYSYASIIPNGTCDAFYMWNYKAKFLAYNLPGYWINIFSNHLIDSHQDYPMNLPCIIARMFVYNGSSNDIIPNILAIVFTISCFILVFLYLKKTKNYNIAIISLCILSSSEEFIFYGVWQCADIVLALYILIAIYEFSLWINSEKAVFPAISFCFASIAFWTKNEGILFFILFIISYIIIVKKKHYNLRLFNILLYSIPVLLALSIQYSLLVVSNDLANGIFNRLSGIFDKERYDYILYFSLSFLKKNIWLFVLPICFFISDKRFITHKYIIIIPIIAVLCYCFVYLITPHDVYWHIRNSFYRIMQHYIPAVLFLFLLLFPSKMFFKEK